MSDLILSSASPDSNGRVLSVTPESVGWSYVGFAVHCLGQGRHVSIGRSDRETCIVVLTGTVTVATEVAKYAGIGGRETVFEGPPAAVYLPWRTAYSVHAETDAEFAICTAPGNGSYKERLIPPGSLASEVRGRGSNTRFVQDILPESAPAHSLLVVEVLTPGGNWSSYPPHKHDQDALPAESSLEETYYHRLAPQQGFAFQRVYTDDGSLDETMTVRNGDCVIVPRGYHPVGAPHGYDLYYLNVMAGPVRTWAFRNDPAHEWIIKVP